MNRDIKGFGEALAHLIDKGRFDPPRSSVALVACAPDMEPTRLDRIVLDYAAYRAGGWSGGSVSYLEFLEDFEWDFGPRSKPSKLNILTGVPCKPGTLAEFASMKCKDDQVIAFCSLESVAYIVRDGWMEGYKEVPDEYGSVNVILKALAAISRETGALVLASVSSIIGVDTSLCDYIVWVNREAPLPGTDVFGRGLPETTLTLVKSPALRGRRNEHASGARITLRDGDFDATRVDDGRLLSAVEAIEGQAFGMHDLADQVDGLCELSLRAGGWSYPLAVFLLDFNKRFCRLRRDLVAVSLLDIAERLIDQCDPLPQSARASTIRSAVSVLAKYAEQTHGDDVRWEEGARRGLALAMRMMVDALFKLGFKVDEKNGPAQSILREIELLDANLRLGAPDLTDRLVLCRGGALRVLRPVDDEISRLKSRLDEAAAPAPSARPDDEELPCRYASEELFDEVSGMYGGVWEDRLIDDVGRMTDMLELLWDETRDLPLLKDSGDDKASIGQVIRQACIGILDSLAEARAEDPDRNDYRGESDQF